MDFHKQAAGAGKDDFVSAVAMLRRAIGCKEGDVSSTPISRFKASYSSVLDAANFGEPQVIGQGGKRFLLLSEDAVIALAAVGQRARTLADVANSIERPIGRPLDPARIYQRAVASRRREKVGDHE